MINWYVILDDEEYTMLLFESELEALNKSADLGWIWTSGSAKHIAIMDGSDD